MNDNRNRGVVLGSVTAALLLGCGGPTTERRPYQFPGGEEPVEAWENVPPVLRVVSPGRVAVGDEMTFAGAQFVAPEHGRTLVRLAGTFVNDLGQSNPVDLTVQPEWIGPGELRWTVGPDVVFDATGERIGSFSGSAIAVNEPHDRLSNQTHASEPVDVAVDVTPSVLVRQFRPEGSSCGSLLDRTIEGAPLEFVADAIGIAPGTPDRPITVTYQFIEPQFVVMFRGESLCAGRAVESCTDRPVDQNPTPEDLLGQQGAATFEQEIEDGSTRLTLGARWQTRVRQGGEVKYLTMFRAGALRAEQADQVALLNLRAVDGDGNVATRTVKLDIRRVARLAYNGNQQVVERYQPVQVSACIPGTTPATEAQYSESTAEVRSRSLSFNWNYSVADSLGFSANVGLPPWNPFFLNVGVNANRTWNEGFGMDVTASVSTEHSQVQGLSGQIFPGEYGMFYRQTERLERVGIVEGTNECGVTAELGEANLTDWVWAAELAKDVTCPPRTSLPPAGPVR